MIYRVFDRRTNAYVGKGWRNRHWATVERARIFTSLSGVTLSLGTHIPIEPVYRDGHHFRSNASSKRVLDTERYKVERLVGGDWI